MLPEIDFLLSGLLYRLIGSVNIVPIDNLYVFLLTAYSFFMKISALVCYERVVVGIVKFWFRLNKCMKVRAGKPLIEGLVGDCVPYAVVCACACACVGRRINPLVPPPYS